MPGKSLLASFILLQAAASLRAETIIVDAAGGGDYVEIKPAVDAAGAGDSVLVKPGEYVLQEPLVITMPITVRSEAGPAETTVRLREDAPSGFVIVFADREGGSVVEGFTITGGREGGVVSEECCGSLCLPECNGPRSPTLVRCLLTGNAGSGAYVDEETSLTLKACRITGNGGDGVVCEDETSLVLENCIISGNRGYGIRMPHADTLAALTNCTLTGNLRGPALKPLLPVASFKNSIVWGHRNTAFEGQPPDIVYSSVEGGWPGEGNSQANPLFLAPGRWDDNGTTQTSDDDFWVDGDYRLADGSPLIDQGTKNVAPAVDLEGNARPCGKGIDMGAFENDCGDRTFLRGDCNGEGGVDISDAVFSLFFQFAGGDPPPCLLACDVNAEGGPTPDLSDPIYLLNFLFTGGVPPKGYPECDRAEAAQCAESTCAE